MKAKLALVVTLLALAFGAGPFAAIAIAQNEGAGSGDNVTQDQSASNDNGTEQKAESEATTEQANTVEVGGLDCDRCANSLVSLRGIFTEKTISPPSLVPVRSPPCASAIRCEI